jgi:ribosomal protein S18 acetylase RimI-like enzyme
MTIRNSTIHDIDNIFYLYEQAVAFQKTKDCICWPEFERTLVETEVAEDRQWKLVEGNAIHCVWATTFSDPDIWEEKNSDAAVYIHRIATDPTSRGKNYVAEIILWAKKYAAQNGKQFIRMDTAGENKGLIKYYTGCGFNYLGLTKLKNVKNLPPHYKDAIVCLFELPLH